MTNEKKTNEMKRGFHRTDERYLNKWKAEVLFGLFVGECFNAVMVTRWVNLGQKQPSARLECYADAFHLLPQFADVIDRLAEQGKGITEPEFAQILIECGFEDITEYRDRRRVLIDKKK